MKQKGQALVEFILILPIIVLIIIYLIDVGNIFMQKNTLNSELETLVNLYQNNEEKELKAYAAKENIKYNISKDSDLITITAEKKIKVSAPGLSKVLGENYSAKAEKTFYQNERTVETNE